MRIWNIRLGHACNSSSSHSLIFLRPGTTLDEVPARGMYGTDSFTLTTDASKRDYLAAQLYMTLRDQTARDMPAFPERNDPEFEVNTLTDHADRVARETTEAWLGVPLEASEYGEYIDHQSVMALPSCWDGSGIEKDFFRELTDYIMQPSAVILGGGDNTGDEHPDRNAGVSTGLHNVLGNRCVARRDPSGFWTLFNRATGAKIRLSMQGETLRVEPTKAARPELVDLKITNRCSYGCAMCYQGSTPDGQDAEITTLVSLARALGTMQVFEVALGGGEPTLYSYFEEFGQMLQAQGIVPNFTTRNLAWLRDPAKTEAWKKIFGAFAYSAMDGDEVRAFAEAVKTAQWPYRRSTVQHIVGVADEATFRGVIAACAETYTSLTLLGPKTTGRGATFAFQRKPRWLEILREYGNALGWMVRVDTALVDTYYDDLIAAGVPETCMTRYEGAFSCYVDAVDGRIARSSYHTLPDEEEMLDPLWDAATMQDRIMTAFAGFN